MGSYEMYREARDVPQQSLEQLEFLKSSGLQGAWVEMRAKKQSPTGEVRQEDVLQLILATGGWFRENILNSSGDPGKPSRKQYFLDLFDTDPDKAVSELDELFNSTSH